MLLYSRIFECQQRWNVLMGLFSLVKFKFDFLLTLRLPESAGRLTFAECRLHFSCVFCLILGNGLLGVFIWVQKIAAAPFSESVKLDSHSFQANCFHTAAFVPHWGTERSVGNTSAGPYEELQQCTKATSWKITREAPVSSERAEASGRGSCGSDICSQIQEGQGSADLKNGRGGDGKGHR